MRKRIWILLLAVTAVSGYIAAQTQDYNQPYRPQVHFSPRENWTNDPNGLVYFQGEYHLFFQYNPFGDEWGHMSWGHAVSPDLLHWHQLPVAIPEANGIMIFTGSVVIDRHNSSGLCPAGGECMVAVYTGDGNTPAGHRETQNLAYSSDRGRTWTKFKDNPVLDLHMADFRDPSVSWNAQNGRWVMAVSLPKEHKIQFYSSPNLRQWTLAGDFGPAGDTDGDWECPDLLRIPSAAANEPLWALKVGLNPGAPQGGSGEQYFLGNFDGARFTISDKPGAHGWTNYGKDDYCAISFNGLPQDQPPVLLGWMSNWQYAAKIPTSPWRGQMSLPRRLTFIDDNVGLALRQEPVIVQLRQKSVRLKDRLTAPYELELTFTDPIQANFGLRISTDASHWTEVGFDTANKQFYIDRTHSGITVTRDFTGRTNAPLIEGRPYNLHLIVDRSSIEAFAQDGTIAMTDLIYPPSANNTIKIFPAKTKLSSHAWKLNSIWDGGRK